MGRQGQRIHYAVVWECWGRHQKWLRFGEWEDEPAPKPEWCSSLLLLNGFSVGLVHPPCMDNGQTSEPSVGEKQNPEYFFVLREWFKNTVLLPFSSQEWKTDRYLPLEQQLVKKSRAFDRKNVAFWDASAGQEYYFYVWFPMEKLRTILNLCCYYLHCTH